MWWLHFALLGLPVLADRYGMLRWDRKNRLS
jgi:hypothetical protein